MATAGKIDWRKRARLFAIARLRAGDPGDEGLALELGISLRAVQYHLKQLRLRIHATVTPPDPVIPRAWLAQSAPHVPTGNSKPEPTDARVPAAQVPSPG